MRPRQSSLGISSGNGSSAGVVACFNEAEAIKPRNLTARLSCSRVWPTCFNEAEAIKPRNPGGTAGLGDGFTSFNEAEAIKPRNPVVGGVQTLQGPASMRPRQSSLGIRPALLIQSSPSSASMRPRQSSLGIVNGFEIGGFTLSLLQ